MRKTERVRKEAQKQRDLWVCVWRVGVGLADKVEEQE